MNLLKSDPRAHPNNPRKDGFNRPSKANGEQNVAHYAGVMAWGLSGASIKMAKDWEEMVTEKSEAAREERKAELYSDRVSLQAMYRLYMCLLANASLFKLAAFDDDAWEKCRHIAWEEWIRLFCEEWG